MNPARIKRIADEAKRAGSVGDHLVDKRFQLIADLAEAILEDDPELIPPSSRGNTSCWRGPV